MTSVRQNTHTTVSTSNSANHDNNLDALLEELQTSVSRPGSSLGMNGNTVMSGYREVTRTVTKEAAGQPLANSTEYQIEYLNPANSTTVLSEGAGGHHRDVGLLTQGDISGRNVAAYKTMSYEYRTNETQDSGAVPVPAVSDARMRQNITELDSLLDDLHTAQKTGFADTNSTSVVTRHTTGIDPGLIEPLDSSTPRGGHVSRSVEKRSYQEQRYGSVGRASPNHEKDVRRELVFTGSAKRDQPSPTPVAHKEYYRYETKTTSSRSGGNVRDLSPPQDRRPSPSPVRGLTNSSPSPSRSNVRTYNYSSVEQDVPRTSTTHRSPSPSGGRNTSSTNVRTYAYSNQDNYSPDRSRQPPVARSQSPSGTKITTIHNYNYTNSQERNPPPPPLKVNSYSYSTTRETRETRNTQDVPRSPPPHRSPSPVSFQQPPLPVTKTSTSVKTYNFDQPMPMKQQSPQPAQKFSPSDPSRTLTYQVSPPPHQPSQPTVITYKYSSHTSQQTNKYPGDEGVPLLPRPFPTPSPTPDQQQQQPPKKLDDLMASFSDTEIQRESHHHETSNRYVSAREPEPAIPTPPASVTTPADTPQPAPLSGPAATAAAMQVKSKNIAGPPVYYPPGVELFAKKEENMSMQQSGGGMKAKRKAKYEYEESSKYKEKSSSGKAVVPVCLPVCCAMPCVIM